jgi:hypothetical protein
VAASGKLYCWAKGDAPSHVKLLTVPVVDVAVELIGDTCAVSAEGALHCWGSYDAPPSVVKTAAPVRDVSDCHDTLCATLSDGSVALLSWESRNGTMVPSVAVVPDSRGFTSTAFSWGGIEAHERFVCGLRDGRVDCAGNSRNELWDDVLPLGAAVSFSGNKHDACVATAQGRVLCLAASGPVAVEGIEDAVEVQVRAVGEWACARLRRGGVRCFEPRAGRQDLHDPLAAAKE